MKSDWISCNTCGADKFGELSNIDGWHIGKCGNCSQIYLNPMPVFTPSREFSEMSLDFQYTRFQHQITEDTLQHDKRQLAFQLATVSAYAGRSFATGRFLDIGCGSGSSVWAAGTLGWQAVGVDIDPALIALGRQRLGIDIRCNSFLESRFDAGQFDFVRLRDVIEHLPNPYAVLQEVKRVLSPGGVVLIATPNEDALPATVRLLAGYKRDKIATVAPPHHVHGFTPNTLQRIVLRAGLQPYAVTTTSPVDPRYVTARNMQSSHDRLKVLFWNIAKLLGRGSMLIAWAGIRPAGDAGPVA